MSENYFRRLEHLRVAAENEIDESVRAILKRIYEEKSIWIIGNGGSASTAEHFETDLSYVKFGKNFPKVRAHSLTANSSLLSAIGNDIGFENIFSHQLQRKAIEGDLCIIISASGNSLNLLNAARYASQNRIETIGLIGFDGGELIHLVNRIIHVQSEIGEYGKVEDVHLSICHLISEIVARKIEEKNSLIV
jgi:D-sedoheptulose 7-phosphate isomerase